MFFFLKKLFRNIFQKQVYLDHASTTPMDSQVFSVMRQMIKKSYGNAGGMYPLAVRTKQVIEQSRRKVAMILHTTADHIIFTRGGTEANNLAVLGVVDHFRVENPTRLPHLITTLIEHDSILQTCKHLEKTGQASVTYIPCDAQGIVIVDEIKKVLTPDTILISVMYANNEIGTIQPIREIAKLIRWWKKQQTTSLSGDKKMTYPLLHTDAIQAVNYCDINSLLLGVDFMTLSGSKIYGPKAVGALFIKDLKTLDPIIFGGGQEFGLRSGTEDSALITGFAKALQISEEKKEKEIVRLTILRDYITTELLSDSRITLNGSKTDRLPNNINISISGFSSEQLVIWLAEKGFAVSSKSACQSDSDEESHVISALRNAQGIISNSEEGSLRITLGRNTTLKNIKNFIKILKDIIKIQR